MCKVHSLSRYGLQNLRMWQGKSPEFQVALRGLLDRRLTMHFSSRRPLAALSPTCQLGGNCYGDLGSQPQSVEQRKTLRCWTESLGHWHTMSDQLTHKTNVSKHLGFVPDLVQMTALSEKMVPIGSPKLSQLIEMAIEWGWLRVDRTLRRSARCCPPGLCFVELIADQTIEALRRLQIPGSDSSNHQVTSSESTQNYKQQALVIKSFKMIEKKKEKMQQRTLAAEDRRALLERCLALIKQYPFEVALRPEVRELLKPTGRCWWMLVNAGRKGKQSSALCNIHIVSEPLVKLDT